MWLPLCSDVYDDVTDFAISGFCKNIKIKISQEWKIFPSNKKKALVTHQGLIYGKNTFVADVTFNELRPYYQKHVNQIILNCKFSKTYLCEYSRPLFKFCESFLESNSPDILALCETTLDGSIDYGNFSVRGYLPLIRKDSSTPYAGSHCLCKGRTSLCVGLISRKLCSFWFIFSHGFTSLSFLLLFPLSITFFVFLHGFWFCFV